MEFLKQLTELLIGYGMFGLIIVAFTESSFFPIPPDVLLIPLALTNPSLALFYALITTLSSVAGAVFGWFLGNQFGRRLLERFISSKNIEKADNYFNKYGGQALAIAGFTPIPYKVFTILSGVAKMKLRSVIVWSIIGRGIRFFLEALLVMYIGKAAQDFIQQYFSFITIGLALLLLLIVLIKRLFSLNKHRKFQNEN